MFAVSDVERDGDYASCGSRSSHRCDFLSRSVICTCVYTNSSLLHNSPRFAYFVPRGVYRGMSDLASPPRPRPNPLATDPQFQC